MTNTTPFDSFSAELGIPYMEAEKPVSTNTAIATTANTAPEGSEDQDFQKSREVFENAARIGLESLAELQVIASVTGEPRAYEVVATLIKSLNETAKQMNEIHNDKKRLQQEKNSSRINVDKAVFVGSQAELLKLVNPKNE